MTSPQSKSSYQSRLFSIDFYEPWIVGGTWLGNLSVSVQNWRHTIAAFGGYDTGSFTAQMGVLDIRDWMEKGLGRGIVVTDDTLTVVWEGFVDRVVLSMAGLELSRGPLSDIGNRAQVIYSTFDNQPSAVVPGIRVKTPIADNLESQRKYGVWHKVVSIAGATPITALQARDIYINEHSEPENNQTYSLSSTGVTLSVECKGYQHFLKVPYNNTVSTTLIDITNKIKQVLQLEPNGVISTDYSRIAQNDTLVQQYENDDGDSLAVIKGLVAQGDEDLSRYLFGIYEERTAEYGPVPIDVEYHTSLNDPAKTIYNKASGEVPPWRVKPGKWLAFDDFLISLMTPEEDVTKDVRNMFIETVEFNSPQDLTLTGGKTYRLDQKLARLGLAGFAV